MNINTELCKVKLQNPTILASGILGVTGSSLVNVATTGGAGAVTVKSISVEERKGHPCPSMVMFEQGMLNAVGLSNPGIKEALPELEHYKHRCKVPLIGSVFANSIKDFATVTKEIAKVKPHLIEADISCPNVDNEFGKPPALDPKLSAKVTRTIKKQTKIPIIIKLSPNATNLKEVAAAVQKAGADAIDMGNTLGPGMKINTEIGKPVLANKVGGVSGPAIFPIMVRCVYDVYEATKGKLPIIGTGGITYGRDAVQMIMAGATAVGIGTAVYYRGIDVFRKVSDEIEEFMEKQGYSSIKQMRGIAHE